jgi:hypothetical protein
MEVQTALIFIGETVETLLTKHGQNMAKHGQNMAKHSKTVEKCEKHEDN